MSDRLPTSPKTTPSGSSQTTDMTELASAHSTDNTSNVRANHSTSDTAMDRDFYLGWSHVTEGESEDDPWSGAERALNPNAESGTGAVGTERLIRQSRREREQIRNAAEQTAQQLQSRRSSLLSRISHFREMIRSLPIPRPRRKKIENSMGTLSDPTSNLTPSDKNGPEQDAANGQVNLDGTLSDGGIFESERSQDNSNGYDDSNNNDGSDGSGGANRRGNGRDDDGREPASAEGSEAWGRTLAGMPRKIAIGVGVFVVLVVLAPFLVGYTGIVESIVQKRIPDFQGTIKIGSSSIRWFSPISLNNVTLYGENKIPLATIPQIDTDWNLANVLFGQTDTISLKLHHPEMIFLCAESTSNWELALAKYLEGTAQMDSMGMRVEVVQGTLHIQDAIRQHETVIQEINGTWTQSSDAVQPTQLTISGAKIPFNITSVDGTSTPLEGVIRSLKLAIAAEQPTTSPAAQPADGKLVRIFPTDSVGSDSINSDSTPNFSIITLRGLAAILGSAAYAEDAAPDSTRSASESAVTNDATLPPTAAKPVVRWYQCVVDAEGVPLDALTPLMRRILPGAQLDGAAKTNCELVWRTSPTETTQMSFRGELSGVESRFSCDAIGNDHPYFQRWNYAGYCELRDQMFYCGEDQTAAELDWGWGQLSLRGAVRTDVFHRLVASRASGESPTESQLTEILAAKTMVQMKINVPEFLRNFSDSLRVRSDVIAESGTLELHMNSKEDTEGLCWVGNLSTTNLKFQQNGQTLDFSPMTADFDAVRMATGVKLRNLNAQTGFFDLNASGTRQEFTGTANFNLQKMRTELSKFIDFGDWNFSGTGQSTFHWTWKDDQAFDMAWNTYADDFLWHRAGSFEWSEPKFELNLRATGTSSTTSSTLQTASVVVKLGNGGMEEYSAALAEPFDAGQAAKAAQEGKFDVVPVLKLAGRGSISRWVSRVRGIDGVEFGGTFNGATTLKVTKTAVLNDAGQPMLDERGRVVMADVFDIDQLKIDLNNLIFRSHSRDGGAFAQWCGDWNVGVEKATQLNFSGAIYQDCRVKIREANFLCWDTVAARDSRQSPEYPVVAIGIDRTTGFQLERKKTNQVWMFAGKFRAAGDLNRLQRWRFTPTDGSALSMLVYGNLDATLDCTASAGLLVQPTCDVKVANFRITDAAGNTLYSDPQISLAGAGSINQTEGNFTITNAVLQSSMVSVPDGRGSLRRAAIPKGMVPAGTDTASNRANGMQTEINLSGNLTYDLAAISTLLTSRFGTPILLQGNSAFSPFEVKLPLNRPDAVLSGTFGWTKASIAGVAFGPATLRCQSPEPGRVQIAPFAVTAGGGKLMLTPEIGHSAWPLEKPTQTQMPVSGGNFDLSLWDQFIPPVTPSTTDETVLTLAPGQVAQNIQLTQEVCDKVLAYASPVLAGAMQAQGVCSVFIDRAVIPLSNPSQADMLGWITFQQFQVSSSPLLALLQVEGTVSMAENATVPIRIAQGRVAHLPTVLNFATKQRDSSGNVTGSRDFQVITSGSIGFDRTLNLVIDMPLPTGWLKNEKLNTALKDQRLRVPLVGTLNQPKLDQKTLDQYWSVLIQQGASNLLQDQMNQLQTKIFNQIMPSNTNATSAVTETTSSTSPNASANTGQNAAQNMLNFFNNALQQGLQQGKQ
ncbi:MAG: hypothetical protein PHE53_01515 [Thermoguttaceae bacterium]|nr:hypothetical protein [Thermoguttaceae bacterium]